MSTVTIVCPQCDFSKLVAREKIPEGTQSINCPKCDERFPFDMDGGDFAFASAGAGSPAAAKPRQISKVALLVITFFLGGFGAHKFYLGKYMQGVIYLLLFWTVIPSLIAFVEFILYLFKSEAELQAKYGSGPVA